MKTNFNISKQTALFISALDSIHKTGDYFDEAYLSAYGKESISDEKYRAFYKILNELTSVVMQEVAESINAKIVEGNEEI